MTATPRTWTASEMAQDAHAAVSAFRWARLGEPLALWTATFRASRRAVRAVFRALDLPGFDDTVGFASNIVFDAGISAGTLTFDVNPGGTPAVPLPSVCAGGLTLLVGFAGSRRRPPADRV